MFWLKKFPFLFIALKYSFSSRDRVLFLMNQFSIFCSILTIGLLICIFSIMNGFEKATIGQIKNYFGQIMITKKIDIDLPSNTAILEFNDGFEKFNLINSNISNVEFIKAQQSLVLINNEKQLNLKVIENLSMKEPISLSKDLTNSNTLISSVDIYNLSSYNPALQIMRHKNYDKFSISNNSYKEKIIYLNKLEYAKLFNNDNYNYIKIYLKDESKINITLLELQSQLKDKFTVYNWMDVNPDLVSQFNLQKKIFLLFYFILFFLLTAIIISINLAFFKEKRKDWALLKIIDISKYSVETIFLYKNLISIFLTTVLGSILGFILTINADSLVNFILNLSGDSYNPHLFFNQNKIIYEFQFFDFLFINSFSFFMYFINFILMIFIFKKEKVSYLFSQR